MAGIYMQGARDIGKSGLAVTSVNGSYTTSVWEPRENLKETMTGSAKLCELIVML